MPQARFEPAIPATERPRGHRDRRIFRSFFRSVLFIDYVSVRPLSSCHLFLYDTQHKHPFHRWDSNPRCQPAIGCRPSHPTARPLGCAHDPLAFESFPLLSSVLRYRCSLCSRTTPPAFLPAGSRCYHSSTAAASKSFSIHDSNYAIIRLSIGFIWAIDGANNEPKSTHKQEGD
jgi:hypothetical protein